MTPEKPITLPPIPTIPSLEKIDELRGLSPALAFAETLVVNSSDSVLTATEFVRACDAHIAKVDAFFAEGRGASDKLHKWFTGAIASLTGNAKQAKQIAGGKVYAFQQAEKRRIEAEQAAAREKARKEAEDAALAEAEELVAQGATAEADRVLGKPVVVEVPVLALAVPKVEGSSSRANWQWEGLDLMATVRAVEAGQIPLDALTWNEKWLTARAKQMGLDTKIPGVRVWDKGTFVAGKTA